MSMNDTIEKYLQTKEAIKSLEKKVEKYKQIIEKTMSKDGTTRFKTDRWIVENQEITAHRMTKNAVPKEIWAKYSQPSSYCVLKISENKVKKEEKKDEKKKVRKSL